MNWNQYIAKAAFLFWVLIGFALAGCQAQLPAATPASTPAAPPSPTAAALAVLSPTAAAAPTRTTTADPQPPASPTPLPTTTSSPTPVATSTPLPTPTPTPIGPCQERIPSDDLLAIVTLEYGISRDYTPSDLVSLSDYIPNSVTLGYPTELRREAAEPLAQMIQDMQSAGLAPMIVSGYRSYATQALAWNKWLQNEPQRAAILSAPPGYSEHQLGSTVDFGSPELPEIVGDEDIQFHTYFYMTSESEWLTEHAHEYGFTLSYPREAFELTGFYYEPWHYRYVGAALASQLKQDDTFLTQHQFDTQPIPCIP